MPRVAVVGAGTMGNGIAHVFAQGGWSVALVDVAAPALERAVATIGANLERQVKKGALTAAARDAALARISTATALDAASGAELVVEAAVEDQAVKLELFGALDRLAPAGAVLASNTSSISITALGARTRRPEEDGADDDAGRPVSMEAAAQLEARQRVERHRVDRGVRPGGLQAAALRAVSLDLEDDLAPAHRRQGAHRPIQSSRRGGHAHAPARRERRLLLRGQRRARREDREADGDGDPAAWGTAHRALRLAGLAGPRRSGACAPG